MPTGRSGGACVTGKFSPNLFQTFEKLLKYVSRILIFYVNLFPCVLASCSLVPCRLLPLSHLLSFPR